MRPRFDRPGAVALPHGPRWQLLHPDPAEQVERFSWRFAPGDKVLLIAKDDEKEVDNGAAGTVKTIDTDASELTGH